MVEITLEINLKLNKLLFCFSIDNFKVYHTKRCLFINIIENFISLLRTVNLTLLTPKYNWEKFFLIFLIYKIKNVS